MSDDIETLRDALLIIAGEKQCLDNLMGNADVAREAIAVLDRLDFNFKSQANEIEIADATIDRLKTDRDSLRKALDDRHAADKKAWSAIMRAIGKERGLPDNKEVIAFYVAEVERLEARVKYLEGCKGWANITADRDSLRAKLDRALVALDNATSRACLNDSDGVEIGVDNFHLKNGRAVLSELSADAPAQFPKCRKEPVDVRDFIKQHAPAQQTQSFSQLCADKDAVEDFLQMKRAPTQPPQISDDVRSLLDEAITALEPFDRSRPFSDLAFDLGFIRVTLAKLRAARNG